MSDIKPCPFCGQQFFVENAINGGVTYRHNIFCVIGQDQRNEGSVQTWETVECMIEALNKRHEEDVLRGEVEDAQRHEYHQGAVINAMEERIKALEAELAELKARTCETCRYLIDTECGFWCGKISFPVVHDWFCNGFEKRM